MGNSVVGTLASIRQLMAISSFSQIRGAGIVIHKRHVLGVPSVDTPTNTRICSCRLQVGRRTLLLVSSYLPAVGSKDSFDDEVRLLFAHIQGQLQKGDILFCGVDLNAVLGTVEAPPDMAVLGEYPGGRR